MAGLHLGVVCGAEVTDVTSALPALDRSNPVTRSGSGSAAWVKWR
jgi:hypothetical protein